MCKTVSKVRVVSEWHAHGCGLGPGLFTDVLRFKTGECTSYQPLLSLSLDLCPATLQLHRPPSPKEYKPVLLCVLSLPALWQRQESQAHSLFLALGQDRVE